MKQRNGDDYSLDTAHRSKFEELKRRHEIMEKDRK